MSRTGSGGYSLVGPLARAQYAAVLRMRWRVQFNTLRTVRGKFELVARVAATGFFTCVWLAIGTGFGFAAFQFASAGHLHRLTLLLWPVMLIWQLLPVMIASAQGSSELGLLLRFPVSFGSYLLLYLFMGIFDMASQMGGIALLGISIGIGSARPASLIWVVPVLGLFAIFNLLLTRMIFAWIERWLAKRRTREILGTVFVAFFVCLQLLNPVYHQRIFRLNPSQVGQAMQVFDSVERFFPPGLTALSIEAAGRSQYAEAVALLGGVALYVCTAGGLLGLRLRAEFRGESLGEAPIAVAARSRQRIAERRDVSRRVGGARWLDGPVGAVLVKELRYLMRSGVMLLGLVTPLIFIIVAGRSGRSDGVAFQYALPLAVAYAFLPLTRQFCNSLGTEGAGIQLYFLSPTPFRSVILAKNLLQSGLFCLELAIVSTIAIVRFGMPGPQLLAATLCWLLFALPANLAAGNILSITMAYRMTLSRVSREEGSVGNGLLSLLVQILIFAIGAAVYLPLELAGYGALAAPVLLIFAAGGVLFWRRVLANVGAMAAGRREALLATLVRPA